MKKNKCKTGGPLKSLGGEIISTGLSLIPGGQLLSPLVDVIDKKLSENTNEVQPIKFNPLPLGNLAKGGIINDKFKQYHTGSHKSGKDLTVNKNGDPDPNGVNKVQNNENSFEFDDFQYVMSDTLVNPKTGNTFNIDAMNANKKYPKARFDQEQKNALKLEMTFLKKGNDALREKETSKKFNGGPLNGVPESENIAWQAQPLQMPILPTLPLTSVSSQPSVVGPTVPDNFVYDQAVKTDTYDLATDTTNFGTPLTVGTNLSETSVVSPLKETKRNIGNKLTNLLDPSMFNTLGLISKGIGLAGSIVDAFSPAEKEKLIKPDYKKSDQYLQNANIDFTQAKQDAIGTSNITANLNRSLGSNAASYQGRESARLASQADQLGRISQQQNLAQSQLNVTKGQIENQRAQDLANRKYQNQQNQQANEANSRFFDRDLWSNLSQLGSSFNKYAETQKMIKNNKELSNFQLNQQLAVLNSRYPNFKVTEDVMEKLKQGSSIDEIVKLKS